MSITPNTPRPQESSIYETPPTPRWILLAVIVLFLGLAGLLYLDSTSRTRIARMESDLVAANGHSDLLTKQLDEVNQRVATLRGQLEVTSQKLGLTQSELARARSLSDQIRQEQEDSDAKLSAQFSTQIGQVKQESEAKIGEVSTDLSGAKTDIAATRKDLEDTKNRLTSTIGDLGVQTGLIARNRDELEALKQLNERNIFDFNLAKSKVPQRVGPIQVTLRSTDPKHFRFTMTVIADDKAIDKKDRNVNEPMQFYVRGVHAPYEMVVFEVTKDHATGYLSTPKEMASAAAPAPARTQ